MKESIFEMEKGTQLDYKELFVSKYLDFYHYAAVIIDKKTHQFYNALFKGHTIGGGIGYYLFQLGDPISLKQVRKLADKSEDSRAKFYQTQSLEDQKLVQARDQAQQMFQRGGLGREQAYAAYGLDPDGNWLKK